MAIPLEQFARQLADTGLMTAAEVQAVVDSLPSARKADSEQLARELVRQRKLTAFQAQQVYQGKGKHLVLGNYVVLDKLGQGGMGLVLKAQHRRMDRIVALKVLSPTVTKSPEALARFQREVKAAARLAHANIVTAYDADEANGTHFLVLEYVEGQDLAALVKSRGPLAVDDAVPCILQAARGLEYAHGRGVIHRDIKPSNLLLDANNTVKILDMGLARLDSAGAAQDQLTGSGQIMGTVDFMAPEQAANTKSADARADIYSLGVTLWYLLTGQAMYDGESAVEKLMAHQMRPIPSLRAACPAVSHKLEVVFTRMVAKQPAERYQTMGEAIAALARLSVAPSRTPVEDKPAGESSKLSAFLRSVTGGKRSSAGLAVAAKPQTAQVVDDTVAQATVAGDTDPKTEQSLAAITKPTALRTIAGLQLPVSPRRQMRALVAGGLAAVALLLAGILLFLDTDQGTVRIEINDPAIQVLVDGQGATITGAKPHEIELKPGKHGLRIKYGGLDFETDKFVLVEGETVRLDVELLNGNVRVAQGDTVLGERPVASGDTPGVEAAAADASLSAYDVLTSPDWEWTEPESLSLLNNAETDEAQPWLSADGLSLFFQCQPPETPKAQDLWFSRRKSLLDPWEPKVNLGRDINTPISDFGPCLSTDGLELLFVRSSAAGVWEIWQATRAGLELPWSPPVKLGGDINAHPAAGPCLSADGRTLLFTADRPGGFGDLDIWMSTRSSRDVPWSAATNLGGNVNTEHQDVPDWISPDGRCLVLSVARAGAVAHAFAATDMDIWLCTRRSAEEEWSAPVKFGPPLNNAAGSRHATLSADGRHVVFHSRKLAEPRTSDLWQSHRVRKDTWHGWPADAPPPAIAPFDAAQARARQEAWATYLGVPVEYENSIGMKFVLIPPGEFMMGSPADEADEMRAVFPGQAEWQTDVQSEMPRHQTILRQPHYLGVHEVTQFQYETVIGTNPAHFAKSGNYKDRVVDVDTSSFPVENVSWYDAAQFFIRLSEREGLPPLLSIQNQVVTTVAGMGYRFPSEAEWEFAARAGTTTRYWSGDTYEDGLRIGWLKANSAGRTHPVGELPPNPFGVCDLHGNLNEWVGDRWAKDYYTQFATSPAIDPTGPGGAGDYVFRGGRFANLLFDSHVSRRGHAVGGFRGDNVGIRAALPVEAVRKWLAARDAPPPAVAPFDAEQARAHQEAWAKHLGVPVEYENSIGMKFVLIPPGEFTMGSSQAEVDSLIASHADERWHLRFRAELPAHTVVLTRPFYLGAHEVSQRQYERMMGQNPAGFSSDGPDAQAVAGMETEELPVERISWFDGVAFCNRLSAQEELGSCYTGSGAEIELKEGDGYRLPTEAEWEFACRAGTPTRWSSGDNERKVAETAWHSGVSQSMTHPIGKLLPNAFGVYDMHGNVFEWCQDWWHESQDVEPGQPATIDPAGPSTGIFRALRGAAWNYPPVYGRSAFRGPGTPTHANNDNGIRVVLSVEAVRLLAATAESDSSAAAIPAE